MIIKISNLIDIFSTALDYIENELVGVTNFHSKRVAYISVGLGQEFGLKSNELLELACCAMLHDNALTEYLQRSEERRVGKEC